jgi:diketogulonate reductase-like aldo/keto reductase
LIEYCTAYNVAVTAFSPLCRASDVSNDFFNINKNEVLLKIATKHKKSPAQVNNFFLKKNTSFSVYF